MSKPFFVKLNNRGLIKISGEERKSFLQGLISNDINLLNHQPCLYACLLTPQGKFLHDFFISEKNEILQLDCEGGDHTEDLFNRLNIYKFRAKIEIGYEPDISVYAIIDDNTEIGSPDPRHTDMGRRSFEKPEGIKEQPFEAWDGHRIRLGIPDGSRDMVPEKDTLLDCNIDKLGGISLKKGCYIGQEVTARMHYRGKAKKHLYPIEFTAGPAPDFGENILVNGKKVGEMRSSCGPIGLALLKDDNLSVLSSASIKLL